LFVAFIYILITAVIVVPFRLLERWVPPAR